VSIRLRPILRSCRSRQAMVSTAQALSARYQALSDQLAQMYDSINGEITGSVAAINSYAEQIATLNESANRCCRSLDRSAAERSAG
jgi:flagellar hook-associated protein FlgK